MVNYFFRRAAAYAVAVTVAVVCAAAKDANDVADASPGDAQGEAIMQALGDIINEMDDDNNGVVDVAESQDFFAHIDDDSATDLHPNDYYKERSVTFNNFDSSDSDSSVGLGELFKAWASNDASRWTPQEVQAWLVSKVGLIDLTHKFAQRRISGQDLPLLLSQALHEPTYLLDEFGLEAGKKAQLLTELSILILATKDKNGHREIIKAISGVLVALCIGIGFYVNLVRDRQRKIRSEMRHLVSEQDEQMKELKLRLDSEKTKVSRLVQAVEIKKISPEVVEVLQEWKDEDEMTLIRNLEEAKLRRARAGQKLLKYNKRSLFSGAALKSHVTGEEGIVRTAFETAAATVFLRLKDIEEFEQKWNRMSEVTGVHFTTSSASTSSLSVALRSPVYTDDSGDMELKRKDKKERKQTKKDKKREKKYRLSDSINIQASSMNSLHSATGSL